MLCERVGKARRQRLLKGRLQVLSGRLPASKLDPIPFEGAIEPVRPIKRSRKWSNMITAAIV